MSTNVYSDAHRLDAIGNGACVAQYYEPNICPNCGERHSGWIASEWGIEGVFTAPTLREALDKLMDYKKKNAN